MKRFLKKRWLGLPVGIIAVVLLVFLLAGGTLAATGAFRVFDNTVEVNVLEPLEVSEVQIIGWFWDWHTPEVPAVQQEVYAGMDLGAAGWGGKYLIHNISPQPIEVTITVSESSGQTDWYGLRGFYSTLTHTGADTCNWDEPFVYTNPGINHSVTLTLGATDYPTGTLSADVLSDSNSIMIFVEAKIKDNASLTTPLDFTITVDRGH